ncbi:serine O-acetyltransferase [Lentimicrobium sp. S6]|uniref:serine O-acetyltransferase n=1 Tax=Lentimicrobium sp. S6 TaxID=2735872 RepID=UPI001557D8D1|nr:serine O-acetyltransferase [Lentimicrobium sp. S6]NPD46289.1 serine acetyltransferase [Lentimicrobium sp. S6]
MRKNNFIQSRGQFLENSLGRVPRRKKVHDFLNETIGYLFPILSFFDNEDEEISLDDILVLLKEILESYDSGVRDTKELILQFKEELPKIYETLIKDATAIYEGDPAAKSIEEVIISYPGFYAILVYRIAHVLNNLSVTIIPRMLTEFSHSKTGIDIHAHAKIGESFCIDHGTGIVIGETTEIGKHVKIYQGVTLGALSVSKSLGGKKRHPSIEDHTVIYAGSTILGGETIIGHHSTIGGNVWLTQSVAPHSVVLNQAKIHLRNNQQEQKDRIDFVI